jgi:N-acetylglucosaminyl-diphospho-decaprenol L-rhamnosyltransferase
MTNFEKNITFVIVSFNSEDVIENCIKSINSNVKIIVVENSSNIEVKNNLENKFSNVEVIVAEENLGYGKGNNLGLKKVLTKYAFILNPDALLDKNCLAELQKAALTLQNNFTILAPNFNSNHGFFLEKSDGFNIKDYKNHNIQNSIKKVDYVIGFAMLINLQKISFKKIFDENIFLFLEEIDLCKRIKDIKGDIFIVKNAKVKHLEGQSSSKNLSVELCREWHWMWSLFYYNRKHFGVLTAYKVTIPKFLSSIYKSLIGLIFFKKKKYLTYKYRVMGLIAAYRGKSSWIRPQHTNFFI